MTLDERQLETLADTLVDADDKLMEELVGMRKRHHLTQAVVAERMGVSQPSVAAFERYDANPTLATIRRYALAVGASITHVVEDSCCGLSDESFYAVVKSSGLGSWNPAPPSQWSWASGPITIRAHVNA